VASFSLRDATNVSDFVDFFNIPSRKIRNFSKQPIGTIQRKIPVKNGKTFLNLFQVDFTWKYDDFSRNKKCSFHFFILKF
jgi:hypothetical protein